MLPPPLAVAASLLCFVGLLLLPPLADGFSPSNWTQLLFEKYGGSDELLDVSEMERVVSIITNEKHSEVLEMCHGSECSVECITLRRVYETELWPFSLRLSQSNFEHVCPSLLYMLTQDCAHSSLNNTAPPTQTEVWGYSVLFCLIISLSTLIGALVVLPCHGTKTYDMALAFLIALATGCLVSNSAFALLPEAFGVHDDEYLWKACTIVGGLYIFYFMERLLHLGMSWRCCRLGSGRHEFADGASHGHSHHRGRSHHHEHCRDVPHENIRFELLRQNDSAPTLAVNHQLKVHGAAKDEKLDEGAKVLKKAPMSVAPAAYVILIGHAFHNLLQGMSIGAAFSTSTILGVSVSIAIICEELPHGLGDFAILLSSGMKRRQALLLNFLSGCPCFVGLIIGIKLSAVTKATSWILGAAGGIFLYIGLADMLPEMNAAAEDLQEVSSVAVFALQNAGLLTGFVGMAVLAVCSKALGAH